MLMSVVKTVLVRFSVGSGGKAAGTPRTEGQPMRTHGQAPCGGRAREHLGQWRGTLRRLAASPVGSVGCCSLRVLLLANLGLVAVCSARDSLWDRLENGEAVTIVVFGDSISAGYQIRRPEEDSFYAMFGRALREAFPDARVNVLARGFPGFRAQDGLAVCDEAVVPVDPDLVTVQFGGNDERLATPESDFRSHLKAIVGRIRKTTEAETMLIVQPFQQRQNDSQMALAIQQIARDVRLPLADFDTALRSRPHDVRGWYAPFFNHPRAYSSNIMAQELWRAFGRMAGRRASVALSSVDVVRFVRKGGDADVAFEAVSLTDSGQTGMARVHCDANTRTRLLGRHRIGLGPRAVRAFTVSVPVPDSLLSCRSVQLKVPCFLRTDRGAAFDTTWLTYGPVILPSSVSGQALSLASDWPQSPSAVVDTRESIVLGRGQWQGVDDLSASFWCSATTSEIVLGVDVRDDVVLTQHEDPQMPMFFGDCVQVNLDCRPLEQQGMPFFDEDVPQLFLVPGHDTPWCADWSFGDRPERTVPPSGRWQGVRVSSALREGGYRIRMSVPIAALRASSRHLSAVGFDVAIDDTDTGGYRDTQMVWAGTADNYLNPSFYGTLLLDASLAPDGDAASLLRMTFH